MERAADGELELIVDRMNAASLAAIARHGPEVNVDLRYDGVHVPRCETLVIRIPPAVGDALVAALSQFRSQNPLQHVYRPSALHLTVMDLTRAVLAGHGVDELLAVVRPVVQSMRPFHISMRGLAVLPYSLVSPVAPADNGLSRMQRALEAALSGRLPGGRRASPTLQYATVARFMAPSVRSIEDTVRRWRGRDFGSFLVSEAVLVNTNKLFDHGDPLCRARRALGE